jgi:CheY-like chemotaxis protein
MRVAKIMVVDDEPLLRMMLADGLKEAGHTVVTAESGSAAIALARRERPDCILLDIIMPGLDGYETCGTLKADPALARIPVFLVSATTDLRVVDRADAVGAAGVLPKPVEMEELRHTVALALSTPPAS